MEFRRAGSWLAGLVTTLVPGLLGAQGLLLLGSEGLPYGLEGFELVGKCASFGSGCERGLPVAHHGEIPLQNMLLRFKN